MLRVAWLLFRKDLLLEWRTRELWLGTLLFVLLSLFVLQFSLAGEGTLSPRVGVGLYWVVTLFGATQMTARLYLGELQSRTLEQWLILPVDLAGVHLGKWAAAWLQVTGVGALTFGLYVFFFTQTPGGKNLNVDLPGFLAVLALFSAATVSLGGVFSLLSVHTRFREVFFPLLLFPLNVPILLAAVHLTARLWGVDPTAPVAHWWRLMLGANVLYFFLGFLMSDYLLNEAS